MDYPPETLERIRAARASLHRASEQRKRAQRAGQALQAHDTRIAQARALLLQLQEQAAQAKETPNADL